MSFRIEFDRLLQYHVVDTLHKTFSTLSLTLSSSATCSTFKEILTHLLQINLLTTPGNIRKPYGFLIFSGGVEKGYIGNKWVNLELNIVASYIVTKGIFRARSNNKDVAICEKILDVRLGSEYASGNSALKWSIWGFGKSKLFLRYHAFMAFLL